MAAPFLEVHGADGARKVPIGDKPLTVGRHSSNVIVLADQRASRYHCVVETTPEGLTVRDLDSSNGTKVNGRLVKSSRIGDGDVVQVGGTALKVVAPSLAPVTAPPEEEEFDVVEVEIEEEEAEDEAPAGFEQQLVRMAESLPEKKFGENEIALVNARGELTHPARKTPAPAEGARPWASCDWSF